MAQYRTVTVNATVSKNIFSIAAISQRVIASGAEIYSGAYVVDPSFATQELETRSKIMTDDVTVNAIQVESVSNIGGGKTIYIGGRF